MNRQGGSHYDGVAYANSGVMSTSPQPPWPHTYRLTFDKRGDFTYICLVHHTERVRRLEQAHIHIRAAGTSYPYTQAQYDRLVRQQAAAILRDGRALTQRATAASSNYHVTVGIGDDRASVLRFFPQRIVVHVGETVTFTDRDSADVTPTQ